MKDYAVMDLNIIVVSYHLEVFLKLHDEDQSLADLFFDKIGWFDTIAV